MFGNVPFRLAMRAWVGVVLLTSVLRPTMAASQDAPAWVVEGVAVPGFGGEMTELRRDQPTTAARVVRGEDTVGLPLSVGMALQEGDIVVCDRARVLLRSGDDESLTIREGAQVELTAERSILQHLGDVFYEVRSAFSVEYGTVETTVEGTRFRVAGDALDSGPVVVGVAEGRVRVTTPAGTVAVDAGQQAAVAPEAVPAAPSPWTAAERGRALAPTVGLGRPRFVLGPIVAGGFTGSDAQTLDAVFAGQLRLISSMRVAGPVRVLVEPGLAFGPRTTQLPVNVGGELMVGAWTVGATAAATREHRQDPCGAEQVLVHIGGAAHVRGAVPLGRHLRVVGVGRLGLASVVQAELGGGLLWDL